MYDEFTTHLQVWWGTGVTEIETTLKVLCILNIRYQILWMPDVSSIYNLSSGGGEGGTGSTRITEIETTWFKGTLMHIWKFHYIFGFI